MGLNINKIKFLLFARERGVVFKKVLMIGRQSLWMKPHEIRNLQKLPIDGVTKNKLSQLLLGPDAYGMYAEEFFHIMGAETVDSIDNGDYEGATILHDLNLPVPEKLKEEYDVILDGGSLEHIFNVPCAIKNCMEMLKVGGHYFAFTHSNNCAGHGFYQFSPELFFSVFSAENGFKVHDVILYEENGKNALYKIEEPANLLRRITFQNQVPAHLMVLAQKEKNKAIFEHYPQQKMYQKAWETSGEIMTENSQGVKGLAFRWMKRLPPRMFWFALNKWNTINRFRKDMFKKIG